MNETVSKFVDFNGKLGRKKFAIRMVILMVAAIILYSINLSIEAYMIEQALAGSNINMTLFNIYGIVSVVIGIFIFASYFSLLTRRLKDLNKTTFLSILGIFPMINIVFVLYLMIRKGPDEKNRSRVNSLDDNEKKSNKNMDINNKEETDEVIKEEKPWNKNPDKRARNIGGLIYLLIIGLFIGLIRYSIQIFKATRVLINGGFKIVLNYFGKFVALYTIIDLIFCVFIFIIALLTLINIFNRMKRSIWLLKIFYISNPIFNILNFSFKTYYDLENISIISYPIFIIDIIIIIYIFKSKRLKETFIKV